MNRYQQQLCDNLTVLLSEDYELLNDMIIDYLSRLDDKDIDGLESYVNSNINEILH